MSRNGCLTLVNFVPVADTVTLGTYGKAAKARVTVNNSRKMVVKWSVNGAEDVLGNRIPDFLYTATYTRASGRFSVTAKPLSYDSSFADTGKCTQLKDNAKWTKYLR